MRIPRSHAFAASSFSSRSFSWRSWLTHGALATAGLAVLAPAPSAQAQMVWTERIVTPSPPSRAALAMTFDRARGRVVLFGGAGASVAALGDTWEWDGSNWTQRFPSTSPTARAWSNMVYDAARRRVVLFGGNSWTQATSQITKHTFALVGDDQGR